ncbi:MAG: hypothetical protein GY765_34885 [bacterium]|nr:hypothetical protein [bacterium]
MKIKQLTIAMVVLSAILLPALLQGNTVMIPGDSSRICYYTDFFYNNPTEDFLYYLNDRLLYLEQPDGVIARKGLRSRLLKIVRWHNVIKKSIVRAAGKESNMVALDMTKSDASKKASIIMNLLGLKLTKNPEGKYLVTQSGAAGITDYFNFALLKVRSLNHQLKKTNHFHFALKEQEIPIPWDHEFLSRITGLKINKSTFFQTMLKDEAFSLLLGTLYRLSDKEINYISRLSQTPGEAWKTIYKDRKFLVGMFMLSSALRVHDNHITLPGGTAAAGFWSKLIGFDQKKAPMEFLRSIAVKDDGKLNYLFLFSTFLEPRVRELLFTGANSEKMEKVYALLPLEAGEKITGTGLPGIANPNFFSLLYMLRLKDNRFQLSPNANVWLKVLKKKVPGTVAAAEPGSDTAAGNEDIFSLLTHLLAVEPGKKKTSVVSDRLRRFVSIYSRFSQRPAIMTEEVLDTLYHSYDDYNVLVDFIEKINIRKPATVLGLYGYVRKMDSLPGKDRMLFTALFQSLLELLAQTAQYGPDLYDYDRLVNQLIQLPLDRVGFYDGVFSFFKKEMHIRRGRKELVDFLLSGISNCNLNINNIDYKYGVKDRYKKNINKILTSQEVCSFKSFLNINRMIDQLNKGTYNGTQARKIADVIRMLPYAEISKDAPKKIRARVMAFSRKELKRSLNTLANGQSVSQIKPVIDKLKSRYLLTHLRDYLLTLAYAANAKNPDLKFFINPNLVRLHDFDNSKGLTAWNYCGAPPSARHFAEYHLCGGLSRLNIAFAAKWHFHLFKRTMVYSKEHLRSVIINLLQLYPAPQVKPGLAYNALLVNFGIDLLREAPGNPELKKDITAELATLTAGYHYRKIMEYLEGKSNRHPLFFKEIKQLGERFFKKNKYMELAKEQKQLSAFRNQPLKDAVDNQGAGFGSIYYHTFGSLNPQNLPLFPQDLSSLFTGGRVSGEMIDEYKIKMGWHFFKKKIPSVLMGQVLYQYFSTTVPRFMCQNHENDYFSTYFMFKIFNNSHLKKIIKNLKKEGDLKLK